MPIHESIERINNAELSDMNLFELSMRSLMPNDAYHELKRRIELIQSLLKKCKLLTALEVVNSLLNNPQETRR
jgi:hypothetical protein